MAMHLHGADGDFWWDMFSWAKLLRLAKRYGWQPEGTTLPDSELKSMPNNKWDGNYTTNDCQMVSVADARDLAVALERALLDIPSNDVIVNSRDTSGGIKILPNPPDISDLDWFCSGDTKKRVLDFITFCRVGGFQIS